MVLHECNEWLMWAPIAVGVVNKFLGSTKTSIHLNKHKRSSTITHTLTLDMDT